MLYRPSRMDQVVKSDKVTSKKSATLLKVNLLKGIFQGFCLDFESFDAFFLKKFPEHLSSRKTFFSCFCISLITFINFTVRSFKSDRIQLSDRIIRKRVGLQKTPLCDDTFGCDFLLANQNTFYTIWTTLHKINDLFQITSWTGFNINLHKNKSFLVILFTLTAQMNLQQLCSEFTIWWRGDSL